MSTLDCNEPTWAIIGIAVILVVFVLINVFVSIYREDQISARKDDSGPVTPGVEDVSNAFKAVAFTKICKEWNTVYAAHPELITLLPERFVNTISYYSQPTTRKNWNRR